MGQRDGRVGGQNEMFDEVGVQRLLLLNATSSRDALEDFVRMFHSKHVIGCIITKLDEAVNLGIVLDVALRHSLVVYYMTSGQGVPDDLLGIVC
jgi:flagellar biosynthesis protein FlhF